MILFLDRLDLFWSDWMMMKEGWNGVLTKFKDKPRSTCNTHWSFVTNFRFWLIFFLPAIGTDNCSGFWENKQDVLTCISSWPFLSGSDLVAKIVSDIGLCWYGLQTGSFCLGARYKKNCSCCCCLFLSSYETFDQKNIFYMYLFALRNHLIHFFVIFAIIDQNLTKIFVKQMPISTKSTQSSKILLRKPFLLSVMKTTWSFPIKIRAR